MARLRAALALAALSFATADVMITSMYSGLGCGGSPYFASAYDVSSYGCAYALAQSNTSCQAGGGGGVQTSTLVTCVLGTYTMPATVIANISYAPPSAPAPRWAGGL